MMPPLCDDAIRLMFVCFFDFERYFDMPATPRRRLAHTVAAPDSISRRCRRYGSVMRARTLRWYSKMPTPAAAMPAHAQQKRRRGSRASSTRSKMSRDAPRYGCRSAALCRAFVAKHRGVFRRLLFLCCQLLVISCHILPFRCFFFHIQRLLSLFFFCLLRRFFRQFC